MSKSPPPQQQPQPQQSPSTTTVVVLAASAVAAGVLLYSAYQFFDSSKPPRKLKPPKKINSQALALYSKRTAVAAAPVSAAATMVIRAPSRWIPKMYYTEAELTILLIGHSAASYAEASAKPSVTASTANAVSPVPVVRPAATASAPIAPLPEDVRAVLLPALWRIVIGYTAREECERPANPDIEVMYEHLGEVDLEHSVCDRSDLKGVLSCNMRYCDRCVIRGCAFCTEVKKRGVRLSTHHTPTTHHTPPPSLTDLDAVCGLCVCVPAPGSTVL